MLHRTQAFSEQFVLRRQSAINRIEKKVNQELREITNINSRSGIVVEDSPLAQQMPKMNEDDVARARQTLDGKGHI